MSKKMHDKGITRMVFVVTLVGLVLFALGGTAIAAPQDTLGAIGHDGSGTKLSDPTVRQNEVQIISVELTGGTPSGTFTLAGAGLAAPTAAINFDAPASGSTTPPLSVDKALDDAYGASTVSVVGGPVSLNYTTAGAYEVPGTWYYRVLWNGTGAGTDRANLTVADSVTNATVSVTQYQDGALITGQISPHGGYSATTDYCVQCHSVHGTASTGEYALMQQSSVVDTCATCHSLFGATRPTVAPAGGNPVAAEGTTAYRAAYEVDGDLGTGGWQPPDGMHTLGFQVATAGDIPFSSIGVDGITEAGWNRSTPLEPGEEWSTTTPAGPGTSASANSADGGLYCGSCHTPHGDFGQLVNSERSGFRSTAADPNLASVQVWEEGANFVKNGYVDAFLHFDVSANAAGDSAWTGCPSATITATNANAVDTSDAGACSLLTATDTEGEVAYLYGYKLLSAYPNHSWNQEIESWGMDAYTHDGARWCGRCHDTATPSEYGGTFHGHPTGCTTCHTNPNDGTSSDFPHTSTYDKLLRDYPDLLCINCHVAGELP